MNAMRHAYPIKEAATLAVIQCATDLGASVGTSHHGGVTRSLGLQVERNVKPSNEGAVPTLRRVWHISNHSTPCQGLVQGSSYQPRSVGMTGGYAPPSPAVNYRARVYGVSPRQSHLPSHLARRLAQGASTFT